MKKRGVLSLWKVILLVVSGIVGVAGVAVLSLYLMGRFEKQVVEPQDMSFVQELTDGYGFYNADLGQYEVSSNFKLTIASNTENVTEKRVTLSLKNGQAKDGFVSDGIIKVPEIVELNKAFTVSLEPEYNADILEDWVVGGKSILTAKASNVLLPTQTVNIAVDVPVYNIDVSILENSEDAEIQEVVVGTNFIIDTKFTPQNSKYLFADANREKSVFYAFTSSYISYNWTTERFFAKERSGNNVDTVTVYTFANSYYQKQILDSFADVTNPEELTSRVLQYFEQNPQTYISKTISVKVLDVDVDTVEVGASGKTLKTYLDKYFTLTASSANGNGTLDLSIKDSSGMSLNSLFGQVGIKIPKGNNNLTIEGGKIVKVVISATGNTITMEDYDKNIDYAGADASTNYYLLPNISPKEHADYFWKFAASTAERIELDVNFFYEDENGALINFFSFDRGAVGGEKIVTLLAEDHDYEEDPVWVDNNTINMVINYDESGAVVEGNRDLKKDLNNINVDNIYRTVRYFLLIDATEPGYAENVIMQESFVCNAGVVYKSDYRNQNLQIPGTTAPEEGYTLYELPETGVLTAKKSFAGKVKVIAVTVKTDANDRPYKTADGKYLIVKSSRAKDVLVESTLSISNMEPTFNFVAGVTPNAEHNNDYYLPAINRNVSNEQKTMINIELILKNCEDVDVDTDKVINAFQNGNLNVICLDRNGRKTDSYVTLQGLKKKDFSANEIVFEGNLAIEESFFTAGKNAVDKGTYIKLQLQYNDGKDTYTKDIYQKDDANMRDHFFIYYQQPIEMKGEFENQTDLDANGDLVVDPINVSITADAGTKIQWGNRIIAGATTEEILANFNDLLEFSLKDQFGNTIDTSIGIYKIKFVEIPPVGSTDNILSFDSTLSKIQNFSSTQGETKQTTLKVYVVDQNDEFVFAFDQEGNVTTDPMASQDLSFVVKSEGLSRVEYDTERIVTKHAYADAPDKSNVVIEKYVSSGDVISMDSLIKVYISGSGEGEKYTGDFVFKLDRTYISSLSSKNKVDIMSMIQFNVATAAIAEGETNDSIENYTEPITTMSIINPFKDDTQIIFNVTDTAGTLYSITVVLVCKSDINVTLGFNNYYEKNADYLVQKGNAVGVFAGQAYDLDEYLKLSQISPVVDEGDGNLSNVRNYSWVSAFKNAGSLESSPNGVFNEDQGLCYLSRVVDASGATSKIMLNIKDTYQLKTVSIKIYYGINSEYACFRTFTLYVNPNLVVRQDVATVDDTPFVNLQNINDGSAKLATSYQLYSLTDYISNGYTFDGCTPLQSSNVQNNIAFTYENVSTDKYITINQQGSEFLYNFVNGATLQMKLGDKISQEFKIMAQKIGVDSQPARIDAVKIVQSNNGEKKIHLCSEENPLSIAFNIGYGNEDADKMAANVLTREGNDPNGIPVGIVKYNNEIYMMLLPQTNYNTKSGFVIRDGSTTGDLYKGDSSRLSTRNISNFVSFDSNAFQVEKTIGDKSATPNNLTLVISMKAIVSKVGENFVYYDPAGLTDDVNSMKYNAYDDVDFKTLIDNYTELEKSNVAQTLKAGNTYTIVHDSQNEITDAKDAYGFYFNGETTNIAPPNAEGVVPIPDSSYKIDVVKDASGYVENLVTLEKANPTDLLNTQLKINHLESSQEDVYIVLRFEIYKYTGSVNYVWYYRIKVEPSFTIGKVTYPYVSGNLEGEYLDEYSNYYNPDTGYEIDLEETFNAQNSKYDSGKRFADIVWTNGISGENAPTLTANYKIKSATANGIAILPENYVNYFEHSFVGSKFKIKDINPSTQLTLILEKSFVADGVAMIGSEMQYIMKFNQGSNYVHSLKIGDTVLTSKNNVYQAEIQAGSDTETVFTADIKISSNGTESKVNNYSAYISGTEEDLSKSLKVKTYLLKGAKSYTDATGGTELGVLEKNVEYGDWEIEIPSFTPNSNGIYTFVVGDKTYFVKEDAIAHSYAFLDAQNKLHIMPKESIDKDSNFQIGFFTDEKVVFKINLTVTSFYNWELNSTFKGGKMYSYLTAEDSIFKKLESSKADIDIKNFELTLKNGEEVYSEGVKISDLIIISNATETGGVFDWQNATIEFAHLTAPMTKFVFEGKITPTSGEVYTFTFEMNVAKSFDESKTRRFVDTATRYGELPFMIEMDTIKRPFAPEFEAGDNTQYFFTLSDNTLSTTVTETPNSVATSTTVEKTYTLISQFNGKEIFRFNVLYRYSTKPNVEIETNYPSPNGETYSTEEYIGTTEASPEQTEVQYISSKEENFFDSLAMFGKKNRVVATTIAKNPDGSATSITQKWTINVAEISNAVVYIDGYVTKTIGTETEDTGIVENLVKTENPLNLNFTFGIVNSSSNGTVVFNITVNDVTTVYKVVIVKGSVITISTNPPNYVNNKETIYAEDLAKQTQKELFSQDRILKYAFNSSAVLGQEYYLRYFNATTNEVQIVSIVATDLTKPVNIDLGKSFKGYEYKGTFNSRAGAERNLAENKIDEASIYLSNPMLTSRIVASYFDNTPIVLNENIDLLLTYTTKDTSGTDIEQWAFAQSFTLSTEDFGKEKELGIELGINYNSIENIFDKRLATGWKYRVFLDLEFDVNGNADKANERTVVDVNAGSSRTLLSYTQFGIQNARTGLNYTQETLAQSSGKINLQIYGFTELKVGTTEVPGADDLQKVAGEIHTKLQEITTDGIKYHTGLTPRAGMTINEGTSGGDLTKNYITLEGIRANSKEVDYKIFAQGANNDGNHVMMRLTYSVVLDEFDPTQIVSRSHNILFRVLPNSEIKFKSKDEAAEIYNPNGNDIENFQTFATNKESPFDIQKGGENMSFNLWNNGTISSSQEVSAIVANLYGSNTNSAHKFVYTYTLNHPLKYNDFDKFNDKITNADTSKWARDIDYTDHVRYRYVYNPNPTNTEPDTKLSVSVPLLTMGERNFVMELENDFGFKIKFYFKITAEVNPKIVSINNSEVQEGNSIAFGLRYQTVSPTRSTSGQGIVYNGFNYQMQNNVGDGVTPTFANTIKLTTSGMTYTKLGGTAADTRQNYTIDHAYLNVTLAKELPIKAGIRDTALEAGTVIRKDFGLEKIIADTSRDLTIWENGKDNVESVSTWTLGNSVNKVALEGMGDLENSICVLELVVTRSLSHGTGDNEEKNTNEIGWFTAEYLNVKDPDSDTPTNYMLKQIHTVSSNYENPVYNDSLGKSANTTVTLGSISAKAYSNNVGAVDKTSAQVSMLNSVYVGRVDFFLNDKLIGSSLVRDPNKSPTSPSSTSLPDETTGEVERKEIAKIEGTGAGGVKKMLPDTSKVAKFITNGEVSFVNEGTKTITRGYTYDSSTMDFEVPKINGILYGTNDILPGVEMVVTLISADGDESTASYYVTLKRQADTEGMFSTDQDDNTSPVKNDSQGKFGGILYDDTLQVKLDPGASIQFAISNTEINEIKESGSGDAIQTKPTNPFEEQRIISLTNNRAYSVTEYVGISSNIVGLTKNLEANSPFHICVKEANGATLVYGNSDITLPETQDFYTDSSGNKVYLGYKATKIIGTYDGIRLNIENEAELNSSNYKTETLYFLYNINGQYYQYMKDFHVYPKFERASHTVDNYFQVDNYIKMDNAEYNADETLKTAASKTHYIIRLEDWAKDIQLIKYYGNSGDERFTDAPYQYYYSINSNDSGTSDGKGSGSAFIDENGMITTTEDFDIKYHTISINVYMKVSGFDATFGLNNTKLKLGQFRIFLKYYTESSFEKQKMEGNKLVLLPANNNYKNVMVIPEGYNVYSFQDLGFDKIDVNAVIATDLTFASEVGQRLDFANMFGKFSNKIATEGFDLSTVSNKNYHLTDYTINGKKQYVYIDNLNSWTFETAGTYSISVLVTGRAGDAYVNYVLTSTVIVYETSTREEQQKEVSVGDGYDLNKDGEGYTWYLINNDKTVSQVSRYESTSIGIHTNTYIAEKNNVSKIVSITNYCYSGEETREIALVPMTTFYLSNILEKQEEGALYNFYKISDDKTIRKLTTESFENGVNTSIIGNYIVEKKVGGVTVEMKKYIITYKFISTKVNSSSTYINTSENMTDVAKDIIAQSLNAQPAEINLQDYNSTTGWIENTPDSQTPDATKNVITKKYFVTMTKNGVVTYHRFDITFYVSQGRFDVDYQTPANTAFDLSSLNSIVHAKTGLSASIVYYELNGNDLKKVDVIPLEQNINKTYYVKVGDVFYLFNFNFYVYTSEQTISQTTVATNNFDLTSLNSKVIEKVGAATNSVVTYYQLSDADKMDVVTTTSINESVQKTYYVKVNETNYLFKINFTIETA